MPAEVARFPPGPDLPRRKNPAFTVGGLDPRKVGAGGNTGPHYFVAAQRRHSFLDSRIAATALPIMLATVLALVMLQGIEI